MPVQIRPTRLEVTDRFPMLGFSLRSSEGSRIVEIVLASDLAHFVNREGRNSGTFYSSREHGTLTVPAGGSVFNVPPEVIARFIAADRLYVGLASASAPGGQDWVVDVMPGPQSPYVSLRGLSDRALRRVRVFPAAPRSRVAAPGSLTEWAGDRVAAPPAPAAAPTPVQSDNASNGSTPTPVPYDDGFGPLPPLETAPPVPATAPPALETAAAQPVSQGLSAFSNRSPNGAWSFADEGEEYQSSEAYGIDGPTHVDEVPAAAQAMSTRRPSPLTAAEYPGVTRIMASPHFRRRDAGARRIERIVIHITSTPQRPSLGSGFMGDRVASAHYLVDQLGGIIQFVREQDEAFHARSANPNSIGIEHVAVQRGGARYGSTVFPYDPPTQIELETSAALVAHLCRKYNIEPNRTNIVGHAEADPRTTHTDCPTGAWDWDPYMALVADCYARTPVGGVTSAVAPPTGTGAVAQAQSNAEIDPESRGIDSPPYVDDAVPVVAAALALGDKEYDGVSRTVASPAFTAGRAGTKIDRIVIHITDAPTTSSTVNHFSAAGAQASAHYLVGQDGEIVQFVSEADTAWHARGANRRSIGIEHVAIKSGGVDYPRRDGTMQHYDALPPTQLQYEQSALLVSHLCDKYGIPKTRANIIGHNEADTNTTHTSCPVGNWNWDYFMRIVETGQCPADPPQAQGLGRYQAQAMIIDREDTDKINRLRAGDYRDLFQWRVPSAIRQQVEARGFRIQNIEDAVGDLNLDFYKVRIDRFPPGLDGPTLLARFIQDTNSFLDRGICSFDPYSAADAVTRNGANPVGTCLNLDINSNASFYDPRGWDDAAIVISDKFTNGTRDGFYAVTTISTPDTGDHPVSGHRQFGFMTDHGSVYFYTRGADRATLAFPGTENSIYAGGDSLWRSFQRTLAAYINNAGGQATIMPPFSERFNPGAIRAMFGWGESQAQAQALSDGGDTVEIKYRAFIPAPAISGPFFDNYHGDGRGFSYASGTSRGEITFTVDVSPGGGISNLRVIDRHWSPSHSYAASDTSPVAGKPDWWLDLAAGAVPTATASCPTNDDTLRAYIGAPGTTRNVMAMAESASICSIYMSGNNPILPGSPAIDADVSVLLRRRSDGGIEAKAYGSHDGFPSHELYVNQTALFTYDPVAAGKGPTALAPPEDIDEDSRWVPVTGPSATAQSLARALGDDDWSINWDDVECIPQPTSKGCWATAAAMVLGWRDRQSVSPELLASCNNMDSSLRGGLAPSDKRAFIDAIGLTVHPNACYTPDGFREILEANGPVWVTADVPGIHAIVVTGMYKKDGQYFVRITDPWDRVVGSPGAPGNYATTHTTGSQYIMTYDAFTAEFEAAGDIDRIQLAHSGGTHGHIANRGIATGAGYAQTLTDVGDEAGTGSKPITASVDLSDVSYDLISREGRIYDLASFVGMIRPAGAPAASSQPVSHQVQLDEWPYMDTAGGRTQAGVVIGWKSDGAAVGDIVIGPALSGSVADGWRAGVRTDILPGPSTDTMTALIVRVTTIFSKENETSQIGVAEVTLSGNGQAITRYLEQPMSPPAATAPSPATPPSAATPSAPATTPQPTEPAPLVSA